MRESNSFHATCLDTYPPISYLNEYSKAAIRAVQMVNEAAGRTVAAYTFDAGANPVIYYPEEERDVVVGSLFPALRSAPGWKDAAAYGSLKATAELGDIGTLLSEGVNRVIETGVGGGPVKSEQFLVAEDGSRLSTQ